MNHLQNFVILFLLRYHLQSFPRAIYINWLPSVFYFGLGGGRTPFF